MRAFSRAVILASRPRSEIFICILSHGERDGENAQPSKKIIINVARRIHSGMVGTDKGLTSSLPRVRRGRWLKRDARETRANLDKSRPNDEHPRGC